MVKDKILITDLETTGFSSSKDFIVEASFVSLDLKTGEVETLFSELICEEAMTEEKLAGSWIIHNSNLQVEDVMNSESLEFHRETIHFFR